MVLVCFLSNYFQSLKIKSKSYFLLISFKKSNLEFNNRIYKQNSSNTVHVNTYMLNYINYSLYNNAFKTILSLKRYIQLFFTSFWKSYSINELFFIFLTTKPGCCVITMKRHRKIKFITVIGIITTIGFCFIQSSLYNLETFNFINKLYFDVSSKFYSMFVM